MPRGLGADLSLAEVKELYKTLWSWKFCIQCTAGGFCKAQTASQCSSGRVRRLSRFTRYYTYQCKIYLEATAYLSERTLKEHIDLWRIIEYLRENPDKTKRHLIQRLTEPKAAETDQGLAIDLAVRIFALVNCYTQQRGISILEQGLHQVSWHHDVTFDKYIDHAFPHEFCDFSVSAGNELSLEACSKITAARLKKNLGIKFRPTDDIASHLKLDRQTSTLEIFQHTAVLKEHLRVTRDSAQDLSLTESLKL